MIPFPDKKYKIIYADPPWSYNKYSNSKKNISDKVRVTPYDPMPLEDIKNMPVPLIADDDCVLFMWVTFPCLEMGLEVIKAWGFKYKTVGFNWLKKNKRGIGWFMGFGHYTRSNGEICLLATKGKGSKVLKKNMSQVVVTPLTVHSEKPSIVMKKIVDLYGDESRIELFARKQISGWDCWGNDLSLDQGSLEQFL
jgi:N6-adenosine-specific RNA methylase IME4